MNVFDRMALRAFRRSHGRLDRFKLTRKALIRETLLADETIARAVKEHALENRWTRRPRGSASRDTSTRSFRSSTSSPTTRSASSSAAWCSTCSTRSRPSTQRAVRVRRLPRDAIVIYLMNHRSNADYVLVGYVLSGRGRDLVCGGRMGAAFPLEYIFKSFGSYFIRRRYREPLYHTVLERYVQLITRNGVTQGIFLEGGLTRDGKLGRRRSGCSTTCSASRAIRRCGSGIYVVPVAINYDRVLEDRSLLRELDAREGAAASAALRSARRGAALLWWNWRASSPAGGSATARGGRDRRPVPLAPWFDERGARDRQDCSSCERAERLARVQCCRDVVLERIGAIIPVTPVTLACAAIQSFDSDFIPHAQLLERMARCATCCVELNARVIQREGTSRRIRPGLADAAECGGSGESGTVTRCCPGTGHSSAITPTASPTCSGRSRKACGKEISCPRSQTSIVFTRLPTPRAGEAAFNRESHGGIASAVKSPARRSCPYLRVLRAAMRITPICP